MANLATILATINLNINLDLTPIIRLIIILAYGTLYSICLTMS